MTTSACSAAEAAGERIVRRFNAAWSERDCDRLLALLADDCQYMVYEGGPVHVGPEAIARVVRPFMARFARIEFDILRINVTGPVTAHERTEHYYDDGGQLDTRFHVISLLVVKENQIVIWRDYSMPGAEQTVGPLCTNK